MKIVKHFLVLGLVLASLSCGDDDDNATEELTIEEQVENFVTPDLLAALEELGFIFRDGADTPDLTGEYLMSTVILNSSNIPDEAFDIGDVFIDYELRFLGQDNAARTFELELAQGNDTIIPSDTFFSGSGNQFSAYVRTGQTSTSGVNLISLFAFSGVITDDGFVDFQTALLLLDKDDDPNGEFIEVGEGRLFIDEDNLVERTAGRSVSSPNSSLYNALQAKPLKVELASYIKAHLI